MRFTALAIGVLLLGVAPVRAELVPYTIDILSADFYPQLRDSWMFRINNRGVAAGYIATQSSAGPFLPTTYAGGQFQTLGIESTIYQLSVTGINDRGVVVGNLRDRDLTPYVFRKGAVEYPAFPAGFGFPLLYGVNNAGLAYSAGGDLSTRTLQVFTLSDGTVTVLPLSAPGFPSFDTASRRLSDAGLLAVRGYSADFSVVREFLYDIPTGTLAPVAVPTGFDQTSILQVTGSGLVFGQAFTADFSQSQFGFWNADGSFRGFFDVPTETSSVQINNLGQAVGLNMAGCCSSTARVGGSGRCSV
jgi:hypothetical protein